MYKLEIFDDKQKLIDYINKKQIKDYSFKSYQFELKLKTKTIIKTNYFLSFK